MQWTLFQPLAGGALQPSQHQSAFPALAAMPCDQIQLIFNQITLLREKEGDRGQKSYAEIMTDQNTQLILISVKS